MSARDRTKQGPPHFDDHSVVLPDGNYDVLIVDATDDGTALALDLTVLAGDHKGEVVSLRASHLDLDEMDAMGLPGTLVVENGVPRLTVER